MQEIFEKIKERLERERDIHRRAYDVAIQTHERVGYASYARACDEAIEIVNQVEEEYSNSETPNKSDDGWIPVSSGKLPEQPKENPVFENKPLELYLVSVKGDDYPFRAFWNGKFFTNGWEKIEVTAWQPLPASYQPKGE